MTGEAQIPRVTRGAVGRDGVRARRNARHFRGPAVSAKQKIRRTVRLRPGKARDVITGQARSIGQPYVTRRARGARHIHVGGGELVAVEALPDYDVLHGHPWSAELVMTRGTVSDLGAVGWVSCGRGAAVCVVRKTQIARARAGSRFPVDSWLHHAVVARRAARRVGPHRLLLLNHAGVASDTQREHIGVFVVWKAVLRRAAHLRRGDEHTRDQQADDQRRTDARE